MRKVTTIHYEPPVRTLNGWDMKIAGTKTKIEQEECDMANKVIEELQSASKWFAEHGRNANTAIIGICDRALDLINRQRAEIEQYMDYNDKLIESFDEQKAEIKRKDKQIEELVSFQRFCENKAIKEFAERLKATFPPRSSMRCTLDDCYTLDMIDNLVKEMVGDQE